MSRKLFFIISLLSLPISAYAEDEEDSASMLGWAAIGIGVIANVTFVIFNRVRRFVLVNYRATEVTRSISLMYKPLLNMHIMLNSIGYFAGMAHGYILRDNLDPVSLSLAIVMTILLASGIMLKYTSSRDLKIFSRLLHGQSLLSLLLIALVVMHLLYADD